MLGKPYLYVTDPSLIREIVCDIWQYKLMTFDTETTKKRGLEERLIAEGIPYNFEIYKPGLDPYLSEIRLLQIATPEVIYMIDLFHCSQEMPQFFDLFNSEEILKIGFNLKFDVKMLAYHYGFRFHRMYDAMLASKVISNGKRGPWNPDTKKRSLLPHNLAAVTRRYLKLELNKEEQTSDWGAPVLTPAQLGYAAIDVDVLEDLMYAQMPYCNFTSHNGIPVDLIPTIRLESQTAVATGMMELDGIYVDKRIYGAEDANLSIKLDTVKAHLIDMLGVPDINLDSPAQVKKALNAAGVKCTSTGSEVLVLMQSNPVVATLLEYRGLSKLMTSYGNGIRGKKRKKGHVTVLERIHPITGRIHAEFNQMVDTGRFSCNRPNLQQVPGLGLAKFRDAFRGEMLPDGSHNMFAVADLSAMEMRVIAAVSQDPALLAAFRMGGDIHSATAAMMFKIPLESIVSYDPVTHEKIKGPNYFRRGQAKSINFGLAYGRGPRSLSEQIGVSISEARELIALYFRTYPGVYKWLQEAENFAISNRFQLTPSGRIRYFDYLDVEMKPGTMAGIGREGKNTPIQGCNADVTKQAMCYLYDTLYPYRGKIKLVNTVHDELDIEGHPDYIELGAQLVKESLERAGNEILKTVPVVAEVVIGDAWSCKE